MFFGSVLIIIGIIFLLQNLGLLPMAAWPVIWPLLLVALGLSIMFRHRKR